ncbi:hypothetical protein [Sphingomonas sp. NPDC079357]|uniref:hypothetical protein n=1 Tax=Sphingomonas sp. NPDC079357 TaxID=3364518 RepID=UPI00384D28B2
MLHLNRLQNFAKEAHANLDQAILDHGSPIPRGMLTLSQQGDFRPLTDAEEAAWRASNERIIAQHQSTLDYYRAACKAEAKRLLDPE